MGRLDAYLAMQALGDTTVQRHWFRDPSRTRNIRVVATQQFDTNLKMIRHALFEQNNSSSFETAISALLFMMGFSSAVQIETDSPDIIAITPGGRLILVECTLRVADLPKKFGKLVDRHRALLKSTQANGHYAEIYSILICGMENDQIVRRDEELSAHQVILLSKDDLISAFENIRTPQEPDSILETLIRKKFSQKTFQL